MNNLPFSTIHQALAQGALANPGMVFVLHLNPPELGQIALKITAGADQRVHLHFKVDDLAVKQVLSAGWNHLQSSLIAHGLAPDGLTVDLNSTTTAGSF
ncbi:MAG TPA: flagellar hook-length control protein FliK, partial [Chloroflexota bacterium]|nr:flagellar hook-length control protein FliK [Chloroflexota bacterium]